MGISFLKRQRVHPLWQYQAKGQIWRLVQGETGLMVGEVRDSRAMSASFFCIDRRTGKALWEGNESGEVWWVGIDAVHGKRVFLHGFSTPDLPEHKGIMALDLSHGRLVWRKPDLRFLFCTGDSLFASRETIDRTEFSELDALSGISVRSCSVEELETVRSRVHTIAALEFPEPLDLSTALDNNSIALMQRQFPASGVVGAVQGLRKNHLFVFNYYERISDEGALRNILKTLDLTSGEVLFTEVLDKSVSSPAPDSFFVLDDIVFFVKDRSTVTAVRLESSA